MTENYLWHVRRKGYDLQVGIAKRLNSKNTVTLSYGLLNALQAGDKNRFLQLVMRQYLSMNLQVPDLFIDAIADDEKFRAVGNAFLIGLNGEEPKKKEEEKKA